MLRIAGYGFAGAGEQLRAAQIEHILHPVAQQRRLAAALAERRRCGAEIHPRAITVNEHRAGPGRLVAIERPSARALYEWRDRGTPTLADRILGSLPE